MRVLLIAYFAALLFLAAVSDAQTGPYNWAPIVSANEKRTVLLKVETPNRAIDYGSGIVVGPFGYILTAKHLLGDDPMSADVAGLLGWKDPSVNFDKSIPFKVVYVSPKIDLAVLKPLTDLHMPRGIRVMRVINTGQPIMLLGYPSGSNLMATFGNVSGLTSGGRFAADVAAGGGNSGGPIVSSDNNLIGLLIEKNRRKDDGTIELSYALTVDTILTDLQKDGIEALGAMFMTVLPTTKMSSHEDPVGANPSQVAIAFSFDDTKSDHPSQSPNRRNYHHIFAAEPGYTFESFKIVVDHRNHIASEPTATIIAGGKSIDLTYVLESGPFFDRWRGWIDGRIETTQKLEVTRK